MSTCYNSLRNMRARLGTTRQRRRGQRTRLKTCCGTTKSISILLGRAVLQASVSLREGQEVTEVSLRKGSKRYRGGGKAHVPSDSPPTGSPPSGLGGGSRAARGSRAERENLDLSGCRKGCPACTQWGFSGVRNKPRLREPQGLGVCPLQLLLCP